MKKFLVIILAALMILSFVACDEETQSTITEGTSPVSCSKSIIDSVIIKDVSYGETYNYISISGHIINTTNVTLNNVLVKIRFYKTKDAPISAKNEYLLECKVNKLNPNTPTTFIKYINYEEIGVSGYEEYTEYYDWAIYDVVVED